MATIEVIQDSLKSVLGIEPEQESTGFAIPQIGLLRQVFDVDCRSHAPPEKSKQAPIPALLPPDEHGRVRHAVIVPGLNCGLPSTLELIWPDVCQEGKGHSHDFL
jgi:hypothetical protein